MGKTPFLSHLNYIWPFVVSEERRISGFCVFLLLVIAFLYRPAKLGFESIVCDVARGRGIGGLLFT